MVKRTTSATEATTVLKTPKKVGRDSSVAASPADEKKQHKKPHRFKPGTVANREVRRYQVGAKATEFLIPKAPIYEMVKEIMTKCGDFRIEKDAITVLRVALEDEGIKVMSSANRMAQHASRKTIKKDDFDAARDVRTLHPGRVEGSRPDIVLFPALPGQYKAKAIKPIPTKEPEESSRVSEVLPGDSA